MSDLNNDIGQLNVNKKRKGDPEEKEIKKRQKISNVENNGN